MSARPLQPRNPHSACAQVFAASQSYTVLLARGRGTAGLTSVDLMPLNARPAKESPLRSRRPAPRGLPELDRANKAHSLPLAWIIVLSVVPARSTGTGTLPLVNKASVLITLWLTTFRGGNETDGEKKRNETPRVKVTQTTSIAGAQL